MATLEAATTKGPVALIQSEELTLLTTGYLPELVGEGGWLGKVFNTASKVAVLRPAST